MRKFAAAILIGLGAAALVLGTNWLLTALAPGSGLQPLQTVETRTYDWRLTHTVRPETARKDFALVEIDEYSDSVKAAGNVILLGDSSYDADVPGVSIPDTGYPLDVPGIYELRGVLPPFPLLAAAAAGLGHNRFILDPDGPLRHTVPFVRTHQGDGLVRCAARRRSSC